MLLGNRPEPHLLTRPKYQLIKGKSFVSEKAHATFHCNIVIQVAFFFLDMFKRQVYAPCRTVRAVRGHGLHHIRNAENFGLDKNLIF